MSLDYSVVLDKIPLLLRGGLVTLEVSALSLLIGMLFGIVFVLFRISSNRILSLIGFFYVWVVRGTPLLVQLFILYFGLPQIGIKFSSMTAGILGLSFNTGAYITEILRAGIQAVDKGQMEAAQSLGMNYRQGMMRIIAPQAAKVSLAPLVNQFIMTLKNSSIVSLVTITELMRTGEQIIYSTFRSFEVYTVVALIYLVGTSIFMVIANILEKRMAKNEK